MENQPRRLISRIVEFAILFALSAYLLRLGACYISGVWPVLLIIAIVIAVGTIGYRLWKSKSNW